MDLYEHNYLRLRKIVPDLEIADEMISVSPGHLDLYLSVSERCKYTTMLRMTYQFQQNGKMVCQPDMHIRIYHDARIAEVQDRLDRKHRRIYSGQTLEQKWKLNRFLYKWLGYCIFQGHYFHPVSNLKAFNT
ncbi:MAG: DUF1249 domain-containing protein [Gammaproteobacteria bacterium]|nr:DUF1249 domain-containing protein [Gammaproteobacteria bacterium]